ncbi:MAG TPA: hypothetical protein VNT29_08275 [Candidatus Limnocylindrales bacterium]|nr:hypothetical protein [Candidatus Limnocylindrales bacterium]
MQSYFKLRERLTALYPRPDEWRSLAFELNVDSDTNLEGSALFVWSNILKAVRVSGRMSQLRQRIGEEKDPSLLSLFDEYAAAVASGETVPADLLPLDSIQLKDSELNPGRIINSLRYERSFSEPLLEMCLRGGEIHLADVEACLSGGNTAAAKARLLDFQNQLKRKLSQLNERYDEVNRQKSEIDRQVTSITTALRPTMPLRPWEPVVGTFDSDDERQRRRALYAAEMERYHDRVKAYERSMAVFEESLRSLGPLEERRQILLRELTTAASSIESQKAAGKAQERNFLADIDQARDRDLLCEIGVATQAAQTASYYEADPFRGFWTLLGANRLLDLVATVATEPATATEAHRRFGQAAELLAPRIESGLAEIVSQCLAGPTVIDRLLSANRTAMTALAGRLSELPSGQMEERNGRFEAILDNTIATIPDFARLETEDELEGVRSLLTDLHESITGAIEHARSEVAVEPARLTDAIERAQTDIESTVASVRAVSDGNNDLLRRCDILWQLIRMGEGSEALPALAQRLCATLPIYFERRSRTSIKAVIHNAADSAFGLNSIESMVGAHLLTRYVDARQKVRQRIEELERTRKEIDVALQQELDDRYQQVARKYRTRLKVAIVLSILPVVGLFASVWMMGVVRRLKALVVSKRVAPYAGLAKSALLFLSLAATIGSAGAITAALFADRLDTSEGLSMLSLSVAYLAAFVVSVRNLSVIRAHLGGAARTKSSR